MENGAEDAHDACVMQEEREKSTLTIVVRDAKGNQVMPAVTVTSRS
jgi:hypothetical protein